MPPAVPKTCAERIETCINKKSLDGLKEEFNQSDINATAVLYLAIRHEWIKGIVWLLDRDDIDVNGALQLDGGTLLHGAVLRHKNIAIRTLLGSPKVDVNVKNKKGDTALSLALQNKEEYLGIITVENILRHPKLDLNSQETLRLLSICIQNKKRVEFLNLLLSDPRIHRALAAVSEEQIPALWGVANQIANGEMKRAIVCRILMYFLQKKPEPTFEDVSQKLPGFSIHPDAKLWFDISRNAAMLPEYLILCFGFELIFESYSPQKHSLHHPVSNFYLEEEHQQAFESLFQSGQYSINQQDSQGDTVLHIAVRRRILPLVKYLLEQKGIDPTLCNHKGEIPLHLAMLNNDPEILQLLLHDDRMDLNSRGPTGFTVLHEAIIKGNLDAVKFLIEKEEVNINAQRNGTNETPLHVAINGFRSIDKQNTQYFELFSILFKHTRTDVNIQDYNGDAGCHSIITLLNPDNIQEVEKNLHWIFNDPRVDIEMQNNESLSLLGLAIKQDVIVIFKLLLKRLKLENKQLIIGGDAAIPDPETDLGAFLSHPSMEKSPQITAFYAALNVLKDDGHLTSCKAVFKAFKEKDLQKHPTWLKKHRKIAFQYALQARNEPRADLFALTVFFCDGLLAPKQIEGLSEADVEKMLEPTRFFRIMEKLPIELQMIVCNRVYGSPKHFILGTDSEPAFKRLAKRR